MTRANDKRTAWHPPGAHPRGMATDSRALLAHGFQTLEDESEVSYQMSVA